MQFARGQRQRNGYVVVGSGAPRADLVRAGIEAGNRRLVIVGEDAAARAAAPVEWDGESLVEVVVTADLPAQRLTARALGQQVAIELPADWQALTSWGYGASNSETVFTELQVR
jgi:hypothetical protein